MSATGGVDWNEIGFVVFDVDGTLYDQRALRLRMARDLAVDAVRGMSLGKLKILGIYRRVREHLGDEEVTDFEPELLARTAAGAKTTLAHVDAVVREWIERRPLKYLAKCRYPGVDRLFSGLRRHGRTIGVLSDYPARDKLAAMGLAADHVVSAGDVGVGQLKPDPHGLEILLAEAGASAATTLLIGDRIDRDGEVARRAGVRVLIRAAKPIAGWRTFDRFDDPLFAPMLDVKSEGATT